MYPFEIFPWLFPVATAVVWVIVFPIRVRQYRIERGSSEWLESGIKATYVSGIVLLAGLIPAVLLHIILEEATR